MDARREGRILARAGAVAGLLLLAPLAGAWAGELLREDFDRFAGGVGAPGARAGSVAFTRARNETVHQGRDPARRPLRFDAASRGAISFDLQRRADAPADVARTVFTLGGEEGEGSVLFARVRWESAWEPRVPVLSLDGEVFYRMGLGLWQVMYALDRPVAPGQWVHVDLVWDDPSGRYEVYVDGRAQRGAFAYDPSTGQALDDARERMNREMAQTGEGPWAMAVPLGELLRGVRYADFGVHSEPGEELGLNPLDNAALDNFAVVGDEVVELVSRTHGEAYDPRELAARAGAEGVHLTWSPPLVRGVDQGYVVYRRRGIGEGGRYERLTPERVYERAFLDVTARAGEAYRYSVRAVYTSARGVALESQYPPEVEVTVAPLAIASVAAEKRLYGAGQEIVVTLRGTADRRAVFAIDGLGTDHPLYEIDDGLYVGKLVVPSGAEASSAALTARLTDPSTGEAVSAAGPGVGLDTAPPQAVGRIVASPAFGGEVELAWEPSASRDVDHYRVYRGEGEVPTRGEPLASVREPTFVDARALPGLTLSYVVVAVDGAGNAAEPSEVASATAEGADSTIASVSVEPADRPLRPGDVLRVAVVAESAGAVAVDLGSLVAGLSLAEAARTGRYLGSYTVRDEDVCPTRAVHRVVAHWTDAFGAADRAGPEVVVVGRDTLQDRTPPSIAAVSHDGWKVAGFSGALVAGDVVTVTVEGDPGGHASFDVVGVRRGLPLVETSPGRYVGTYTVAWGDRGDDAPLLARLADDAGNEASLRAERGLVLDTHVRLEVEAERQMVPADRRTEARLTCKATNANGDPVAGHEVALTLGTTEEYTGVVGGGSVEGREAKREDDDDLEVRWNGETDRFGEVTATYRAGFAAKTALVVAKNLTTGDAGYGWLHTYVATTTAIELTARARKGAVDRATLRLSAEPPKLTADGRSTSRLKVWLASLEGAPLAGVRVSFALAGENGRLRVLRATTDAKGLAEAEYRAGTAAGTVIVTASAVELGVGGSLAMVLMSDAPARIDLIASDQTLAADGQSRASLAVRVGDANDNPNDNAPVEVRLVSGAGSLSAREVFTDRNGEATLQYTAGRDPGTVVVEARHTSRAPTDAELRRIRGTLFVPRLFERQERDRVTLVEWLAEPGEVVDLGQTLAVLESGRGSHVLTSPGRGRFVRRMRHAGDRVALGETVGYVELEAASGAKARGARR